MNYCRRGISALATFYHLLVFFILPSLMEYAARTATSLTDLCISTFSSSKNAEDPDAQRWTTTSVRARGLYRASVSRDLLYISIHIPDTRDVLFVSFLLYRNIGQLKPRVLSIFWTIRTLALTRRWLCAPSCDMMIKINPVFVSGEVAIV